MSFSMRAVWSFTIVYCFFYSSLSYLIFAILASFSVSSFALTGFATAETGRVYLAATSLGLGLETFSGIDIKPDPWGF